MTGYQEENADERAPLLITTEPSRSYTTPSEPTSRVSAKAAWLCPSRRKFIALAVSTTLVSFVTIGALLSVIVFRREGKKHNDHLPPLVNLAYTSYEGIRLSNGVNAFLGMRYAAPPLEDLRWRAPIEPEKTDTVEKANQFGPICLRAGVGAPFPGQDEDCLYVNVWAPANATEKSKLPVWVFIGGGGYNALTNANWNGSEVVEKSGHNIVMLDFNYRVGMWGFLASQRVKDDGDLNVGLLDQRMLLTWVKKHISAFGGDPEHVVIHGASAGAGSVVMHLLAYGGRNDNLFVGAMSESLFFPAQPYVRELEYQFDRLAQQVGCSHVNPQEQLACLRRQDVTSLQAANHAQHFPGHDGPLLPIFYWTPCVDGDFLQDLPYRLMRKGRFLNLPLLFGTNTDEGSVFAYNSLTPSDFTNFLTTNYPHLTPSDLASILSLYPQLPPLPNRNPWYPTTSLAYGEATFICPSNNFLNASVSSFSSSDLSNQEGKVKPKAFAYRFNVHDHTLQAAGLGVPHLFDAAAIFGPDNISGFGAGEGSSYKTYNKPVVSMFMAYWVSFVRTLDPNMFGEKGSPQWEAWDSRVDGDGNKSRKRLLVELASTRMEEVGDGESDRCRFWEALGDRLEQLRWVL
ncbi:Alpha/Beta hydrolase protein [Pseudoneurospora amorphoporcata]|uniref:Carboxylic ester hydrolase n=1 Tax=Pseudoneurospora amorphoporcata TaxID=241081 RepID=A0AAN6NPP6_9PEZI|nr:Alpha/Beta hydrolase protein [Pseudoneurospora amorphoporcata]